MKKIFSTFFLIGITILTFAQVSIESTPPSFTHSLIENVPTHQLPIVNETVLKNEDALEQGQDKAIPLRFGQDFPVQLNLNNSGVWENLPNGDRVWRLKVESTNAKSLNFIFNDFYMPQGGEFFIYNVNKTYVIGAFTEQNNKVNGQFSTAPVKGNAVVLEYFEPKSVEGQGHFELSDIVYAYRDMFKTGNDYIQSLDKAFGDSDYCNVDVNCSDGASWQDEKRSIALILTANGTRWCTGAMINNMAQDTTPYFLTGEHCLTGDSDNWVFIFNYESPTCNGVDGDLTQSISGSTTRANYGQSDMLLLELSMKPPESYRVYYAGWDKSGLFFTSSAGIHHPSGDVKKISIDTNIIANGFSYNSDHWRVENWEIGTTEGGSSGSPLFDQNHRIVGQLHGGLAACDNFGFDEYGKFSVSWLGGGTNETQLKHWLDPNNNNLATLDGRYYITPSFVDNIRVDSIGGITACGMNQYPTVRVTNLGGNDITTLNITYEYAGGTPYTMQWTGNIPWLQSALINLPGTTLPLGNSSLTVTVSIPNITDEDATDNFITKNIVINNTNTKVTLRLKTDSWPEELSYKVMDVNNNILFQVFGSQITGSSFENTLIRHELCLADGCYKLVIDDTNNDGLSGGSGSAPGYFQVVTDVVELGIVHGNFGYSHTIDFCVPGSVDTKDIVENTLGVTVFPNPTSGNVQFKTEELPNEIIVFDVLGRRVGAFRDIDEPNLDLSYLEKGLYFLQFRFNNNVTVVSLNKF